MVDIGRHGGKRSEESANCVFIFWSDERFGGMERRCARLASHLIAKASGCDVVILTHRRCEKSVRSFFSQSQQERILGFGVRAKAGARRRIDSVRDIFGLLMCIRKLKGAHFHFCGNPGVISCLVAIFLPAGSKSSIVMVDTTYNTTSTEISRLLAGFNIRRFHRIDCLSDQPKSLLEKYFPHVSGESIRVAPCSFSDYSNAKPQRNRDLDVVMMARFVSGKGYDLLKEIESISDLYSLHCFGSGPLSVNIDSAIVSFAPDPFEVLGRSKVFLSLQSVNNYPSQSVLEAMASGCAIIATDVGETRKFLDGDCAVLIPYDANALRVAIETLMKDEPLRDRLGARARERVMQEHTVERYAKYFLEEIVGFDHPHHHRP